MHKSAILIIQNPKSTRLLIKTIITPMTMPLVFPGTSKTWLRHGRRCAVLRLMAGVAVVLTGCATPTPPPTTTATVSVVDLVTPATAVIATGEVATQAPLEPQPTATARHTPTSLPTPSPTATSTVDVATTTPSPVPTPTITSTATVSVTTGQIVLATYPYRAFQRDVTDPDHNWTWPMLDRAAYLASQPQPAPQTYRQLVLQNDYLRISVLPELGGRLYEMTHKPSGHDLLYKNGVIKPSPWGPPAREGLEAGWLAAGGVEWGLPVAEHGYAWGTPWGYDSLHFSDQEATLTVFQQPKGRLQISTDISLLADEAAVTLRTRLTNPTAEAVDFAYWVNAMLAPGGQNRPSPALHFILPVREVTVHSTGDPDLPAGGQSMSWPVFQGRDLSRLANWRQYLGVFARPAMQAGFMGVYDTQADEGLVRIFPPDVMPGAKLFALGGSDPIAPETYTDDGSSYVEMQGGLAPTFDDTVHLDPEHSLYWEETWYPVAGIGDIDYADPNGALHVQVTPSGMQVNFYPVRRLSGKLTVTIAGIATSTLPVDLQPTRPFRQTIPLPPDLPGRGVVTVQILGDEEQPVFQFQQEMALR